VVLGGYYRRHEAFMWQRRQSMTVVHSTPVLMLFQCDDWFYILLCPGARHALLLPQVRRRYGSGKYGVKARMMQVKLLHWRPP